MSKYLEKHPLINKNLFVFEFPFHSSKMNNDKLSAYIINKYMNFGFTEDNNYNDIDLNDDHDENIVWVENFVKEKFSILNNFRINSLNHIAQINGFLESSYKRNHVNPFDYDMSPHFTSIYVVKGTGNFIIEYPDYKQEDAWQMFKMQPGRIFVFNSDLNYFTDKNLDKNINRQLLITNYKKL